MKRRTNISLSASSLKMLAELQELLCFDHRTPLIEQLIREEYQFRKGTFMFEETKVKKLASAQSAAVKRGEPLQQVSVLDLLKEVGWVK